MLTRASVWLIVFWATQTGAQLVFKHGADHTRSFWLCFVGGQLVSIISVYGLMQAYRFLTPSIALGLAVGGAFVFSQVTLAWVYRAHLAPLQIVAVSCMTVGMILFGVGALR